MIKIAISGKGNVGKNTAAKILVDKTSKDLQFLGDFPTYAFANKLKQIISIIFPGCDNRALYGSSELRQNKITSNLNISLPDWVTYRKVACDLGKAMREYNPIIWIAHVDKLFQKELKFESIHHKFENNKIPFIISDLRFIEEYEWAKKNKFTLIRIKRNNHLKSDDVSEVEQDQISDDKFDFIIENNGSLDDLEKQLQKVIENHKIA